MISNVINIYVDYSLMGVKKSPKQTTLATYILDEEYLMSTENKKRPAVIVCPGGGYGVISAREGEPVALKYCGAGFHSFVLNYSVAPAGWPAAACELSKAVAYVRKIADRNNIDKEKIFICGFSAGGHLAASLGVHYNHPDVLKFSEVAPGENKPTGVILGYPVITAELEKTHCGTIENFVAGRNEVLPLASLENYVDKNTPNMFIWHTFSDKAVPVINSLRLAKALDENGVKFELHIYPDGPHGLSTGDEITCRKELCVPAVTNWIDMSIRWINEF